MRGLLAGPFWRPRRRGMKKKKQQQPVCQHSRGGGGGARPAASSYAVISITNSVLLFSFILPWLLLSHWRLLQRSYDCVVIIPSSSSFITRYRSIIAAAAAAGRTPAAAGLHAGCAAACSNCCCWWLRAVPSLLIAAAAAAPAAAARLSHNHALAKRMRICGTKAGGGRRKQNVAQCAASASLHRFARHSRHRHSPSDTQAGLKKEAAAALSGPSSIERHCNRRSAPVHTPPATRTAPPPTPSPAARWSW